MKLSLVLMASLFSTCAFAADSAPRNETRTRTVGEQLVQLSQCEAPVVSSYNYDQPITKSDGTISTDANGQVRTHTMTRVTVTSKLRMTKCQIQENYMVQVTGSFWNSTDSEIPNTSRQFGAVAAQEQDFSKSQDLDMAKLVGAAGNGDYFSEGSGAQLVMTIGDGLKADAKAQCDASYAQLISTVVPQGSTACK